MHGRPGVHCIRLAAHLLCMETRFRGRRVESAADDSERIKSVSTPRIIPCPPLDLLLPLLQIKSHSFLHTPAKKSIHHNSQHNASDPTQSTCRFGGERSNGAGHPGDGRALPPMRAQGCPEHARYVLRVLLACRPPLFCFCMLGRRLTCMHGCLGVRICRGGARAGIGGLGAGGGQGLLPRRVAARSGAGSSPGPGSPWPSSATAARRRTRLPGRWCTGLGPTPPLVGYSYSAAGRRPRSSTCPAAATRYSRTTRASTG
jgi:hypothetical protein